ALLQGLHDSAGRHPWSWLGPHRVRQEGRRRGAAVRPRAVLHTSAGAGSAPGGGVRDDVVDWVLDGHEPIWTTATAGELWIAEPASKIGTDEPRVSAALEDYGFGGV